MRHSYHGDTIGAMSVGARGVFNAAYGPLLFDVTSIPFQAKGQERETLNALASTCRNERPAAFLVEPLVLGVGGMLMYLFCDGTLRSFSKRYAVEVLSDALARSLAGIGLTGLHVEPHLVIGNVSAWQASDSSWRRTTCTTSRPRSPVGAIPCGSRRRRARTSGLATPFLRHEPGEAFSS